MGQAVWTGSISFGLVSIPVKLYPATEPKDVRFHLYDRRTGKRVRYERVTRAEDVPTFDPEPSSGILSVERVESRPGVRTDSAPFGESTVAAQAIEPEDVVRGFELSEGDLVTVSEAELVSLAPERSRTIEIEEFVDLAEIDPVFFEKSYQRRFAVGGRRSRTSSCSGRCRPPEWWGSAASCFGPSRTSSPFARWRKL